jgi:hypothetical protein
MDSFDLAWKMTQPVRSYIRSQGLACAVINVVLNPAIAWLGNRQMAFVPLSGENSIVVDTAVTSIVLPLLVSLFVTPAARRGLRAGQITGSDVVPWEGRVLSRLPVQAWSFGLLIGIVAAVILTPLIFGAFRMMGASGLPFAAFALLKAAYTPTLGYLVTRWVILRQVMHYRTEILHARTVSDGAAHSAAAPRAGA